ncbi:MAG TPA: alpha/beta hydrolase [Glaciibacter sp.]|nr:alpha/beta hydrolase [Glaciibacter sp.]
MRPPIRALPLVALAAAMLTLGGCSSAPEPAPTPNTSTHATRDLRYATAAGEDLLLNACLPRSDVKTPAVVLVHGGGFEAGNKEGMMPLCRKIAADGFAAFSIDYRLMPEHQYPAQVDDLRAAIEWLREPAQVKRFEIDPEKIGVFGSSAGAIIAASQGTSGTGDTGEGSRVAAVVALSPASDLTESGLALGKPSDDEVRLILAYLGCRDVGDCPDAKAASPLFGVDPTDPPFYIAVGDSEIVPEQQAEVLSDALKNANVPVTYEVKPGSRHALALLDDAMLANVLAFLHENLDAPE